MTTIYIVTSGEYSDYSIDGVFDSREKAETYIAYERAHGRYHYDKPNIEEWELNESYDPISRGLTCFRVWFPDRTTGDAQINANDASSETEHSTRNPQTQTSNYVTFVWAQDEQAALKIANERRVRFLLREETTQP